MPSPHTHLRYGTAATTDRVTTAQWSGPVVKRLGVMSVRALQASEVKKLSKLHGPRWSCSRRFHPIEDQPHCRTATRVRISAVIVLAC